MNAQEVKKLAEADGIQFISIPGGKLKARGGNSAVNKWLPEIKEHKTGLLAILTRKNQKKLMSVQPIPTRILCLGYRCSCGSISYLPKKFVWKDFKGALRPGFLCLGCETRYHFV